MMRIEHPHEDVQVLRVEGCLKLRLEGWVDIDARLELPETGESRCVAPHGVVTATIDARWLARGDGRRGHRRGGGA
jgi:hypothetical protein